MFQTQESSLMFETNWSFYKVHGIITQSNTSIKGHLKRKSNMHIQARPAVLLRTKKLIRRNKQGIQCPNHWII